MPFYYHREHLLPDGNADWHEPRAFAATFCSLPLCQERLCPQTSWNFAPMADRPIELVLPRFILAICMKFCHLFTQPMVWVCQIYIYYPALGCCRIIIFKWSYRILRFILNKCLDKNIITLLFCKGLCVSSHHGSTGIKALCKAKFC